MFSITTVPLSTRMPMARAKPPKVMVFSVWPVNLMNNTAVTIDSGMAASMMIDKRILPKKRMITSAVSTAAMAALSNTLLSAALTNTD